MRSVLGRSQWGFQGPVGPAKVASPGNGWWLHHSVTAPSSDPKADMRRLERIGRERFGRLSYSWAYHVASRTLLQGQDEWIGAHTHRQNSTSKGLVLIGNYETSRLPSYVASDLAWLIRRQQATARPALLGGHRDAPAASTACPGRHGQALIPTVRALLSEEDDMPLTDADIAKVAAAVRTELLTRAATNQDAQAGVTLGTAVTRGWRNAQAAHVLLQEHHDPAALRADIAAAVRDALADAQPGQVDADAIVDAIAARLAGSS